MNKHGNVSLVIERVTSFDPNNEKVIIRVTAYVNDVPYVYPSIAGIQWQDVSPDMESQSFSLPPAKYGYKIRFEAEGRLALIC